MASEGTSVVPPQRMDPTMSSNLLFQDPNPVRFACSTPVRRCAGEPGSKPGFMADKLFSLESRNDDDDSDSDDDDDDDDDAIEGLVRISGVNSCNTSGLISKIGSESFKDHALFGSSARKMMKHGVLLQPGVDGNRASTSVNGQQGRSGPFNQMVTIAEHNGDMYYSPMLPETEESSQGQKDAIRDNGCGFSGRKSGSGSSDPAESLRAIFSDPITGALMDDAILLPCGHSFGGGGIQQVIKMGFHELFNLVAL